MKKLKTKLKRWWNAHKDKRYAKLLAENRRLRKKVKDALHNEAYFTRAYWDLKNALNNVFNK